MSKNYFFHSLHFENYRGLQRLSMPNLRRVNIIGGLNGVGKTTVLDGLFSFLARAHPLTQGRPLFIKNSKLPYPNGYDYIFYNYDHKLTARIHGDSVNGKFLAEFKSIYAHNFQSNSHNTVQKNQEISSIPEGVGRSIELRVSTNNKTLTDEMIYMQASADDVGFNVKRANYAKTPPTAYTTNSTFNQSEDAQRFSVLIKERRLERLYEYLRLLYSDLKSIQLLQESGIPVLYVEFTDGTMTQVALLGGGFQMMLSVCLLIMTMKNSVFLFDEIDNTIHHTLLADFWALVAKLANENNAQVFAVTHSRECIGAAVKGFQHEDKLSDLAYFRLEEGLNSVSCVSYDSDDLTEALSSDWEMR